MMFGRVGRGVLRCSATGRLRRGDVPRDVYVSCRNYCKVVPDTGALPVEGHQEKTEVHLNILYILLTKKSNT